MYEYNAEVLRVIDGDTFEVLADLGFGVFHKIHLRLRGVNASEIKGESKHEGYVAKDYVEELFVQHDNRIVIKTYFKRSFARWVGDVLVNDESLAEILLNEGLAVVS